MACVEKGLVLILSSALAVQTGFTRSVVVSMAQ